MPSLSVFGYQIEFSQFHCVVEDLQHWSTTQTWTEGGGGWVHPQYGGWVDVSAESFAMVHGYSPKVGSF